MIQIKIPPPLAGGDKGEGDLIDCNSILFTLSPALSLQGEGVYDLHPCTEALVIDHCNLIYFRLVQ
jgi:hypothetical protein